jgi:hypothetical protein
LQITPALQASVWHRAQSRSRLLAVNAAFRKVARDCHFGEGSRRIARQCQSKPLPDAGAVGFDCSVPANLVRLESLCSLCLSLRELAWALMRSSHPSGRAEWVRSIARAIPA